MNRLLRRKINRVAALTVSRAKSEMHPWSTVAYMRIYLPKANFDVDFWTPGEGFVQTHPCAFAKMDESSLTVVVGPLFDHRDSMGDETIDERLYIYTRTFLLPLEEGAGQWAMSELWNKPRRAIYAGSLLPEELESLLEDGTITMTPWLGHPWKNVDDYFDIPFLYKHRFDPNYVVGLSGGDWDYSNLETNMIMPPADHIVVNIPVQHDQLRDKDLTEVYIGAKIADRWGGYYEIAPGYLHHFHSNLWTY